MSTTQADRGKPPTALTRTEEERALIEHAKRLLAERFSLTETQSHRMLQRMSMNTSIPLVKIARSIINSME